MNKLILKRKTHSILNVSGVGGKSKQVQIEVRRRRTYLQGMSTNFTIQESVSEVNELMSEKDGRDEIVDTFTNNKIAAQEKLSLQLSNKIVKEDGIVGIVSCDQKIEEKEYCKVKKGTRKVADKKKFFVKGTNNYSWHENSLDFVSDQKNNLSKNELLSDVFVLEKKIYDEKKLDSEIKNRFRARIKSRFGGKVIKQKRNNNNYRSYIDCIDESDTEEKLYGSTLNRITKNKRRQSMLVQSFKKPIQQVIVKNIVVGDTITVSELAGRMSIKTSYMIKIMMKLGFVVTVDQVLDQETAQLVVEEMGHNVILRNENDLEKSIIHECDNIKHVQSNDVILRKRPPVVTVMGHVDHGKTSILDYIRNTKMICSEAGGITQSIGAYRVTVEDNNVITFIDTPGHAAFTSMRARGVLLTDIVVLVIAIDDGVMPQTIEAIQHIRSVKIPVIVAINKIDKCVANSDKIKNELNNYGFIPEEWGGNTQFVNVSAISGEGINDLLEAILIESEMLELKSVFNCIAKGIVIDSCLDKGRGPVITVLIREGTLKCGDVILCGTEYGKVRSMRDEYGCKIVSAGPSIPVELVGLSGTSIPGESMIVVRDEKKAREVALYRKSKLRESKLSAYKKEKIDLKNIFDNLNNVNKVIELHVIIKSDTHGSAEAIRDILMKLSNNEVLIKILSVSIGDLTETDVALAAAANGIILAFNIKADASVRRMIDLNNINIYYYSVIYDLLNGIKQYIYSISKPNNEYKVIGIAKVSSIFRLPKHEIIVGCVVIEGCVKNNKRIKVIRNNVVLFESELQSLRRFKKDVNEVKCGVECGIGIKGYTADICSGDIIEVLDFNI